MSVVINYDKARATKEIQSSLSVIQSRYNNLKNMMLNDATINQIKKGQMSKIRAFLTTLNANAKYLNDNVLLTNLEQGIGTGVTQVFEDLASFSSSLLTPSDEKLKDKKHFFEALGNLQYLLKLGAMHPTISFDYDELAAQLNKINIAFSNNQNTLKETGNALGYIGSAGIAPLMLQSGIDKILSSANLETKNQVVISDTGSSKISGTNRTVTTDTLAMAINPTTGKVQAVLKISDKFNAKYKKSNMQSTGRPVKLATRHIKTFLEEVTHPLSKLAYEKALFNYISYHKINEDDYHRFDITKEDQKGWKILRQAIGAEMMYNDIFVGKGKFMYNNIEVNDLIDLSIYGDKIYLASDVLRSTKTKKNSIGDFRLAQIDITSRRKNILTNTDKLNSPLTKKVLQAYRSGSDNKEMKQQKAIEKIYSIIETARISYSQTIRF